MEELSNDRLQILDTPSAVRPEGRNATRRHIAASRSDLAVGIAHTGTRYTGGDSHAASLQALLKPMGRAPGTQLPQRTAEYDMSFVQRWVASMMRIVPDFERITRLCVLAPSPQ